MWNSERRLLDYVGSVAAMAGARPQLLNGRPSVRRAVILILSAMSLLCATPAHADLTVTIPSATFYTTDGTDTLDVLIKGDGSTPLGNFTLNFSITPDASNPTTPALTIGFVAPPSDPTLDPTLGNPNYVFAHNSFDVAFGSPFGSVSGVNNTSLGVADSTADSISDVTLGNGTTALLAELKFTVPGAVTNPGGDKFDVTLLDPSTSLASNVSGANVAVSGTFTGIVTLQSAPEPGTFGMLLAGVTGLLWSRRRRTCDKSGQRHTATC
jgi:hypothetical protein